MKESKGSWLKTVGVTVTNDTSAYTTTWTPSVGAEIWRSLSKHLPGEFLHTYWELSQCLWGNHSLEKEVKALWDILTWQIPSYISFGSNGLTGFLLLFFLLAHEDGFGIHPYCPLLVIFGSAPLSMGVIQKDWCQNTLESLRQSHIKA